MDISLFTSCKERVLANCGKVIVGKDEAITLVFTSFLCSGHVLLEDVPGTGKTMLLRAFSKTIGGKFKRIQFTPDLLPSDLTGINFYNQKTGEFQFREGPLFSNIILADEINRATPRTPVQLAGSNGGASDLGRWHHNPPGRTIHGYGNPEPSGILWYLSTSGSTDRPFLHEA